MILEADHAKLQEGPMRERLCCPVDVYMLLERGGRLLQAGDTNKNDPNDALPVVPGRGWPAGGCG